MTASVWTGEDRALLLAYEQYLGTLCPGCSTPKETAWHLDNEGYFEVAATFTCHPCTVRRGEGAEPAEYVFVIDSRDYDANPLQGRYTDFADTRPPSIAPPPSPRGEEFSLG